MVEIYTLFFFLFVQKVSTNTIVKTVERKSVYAYMSAHKHTAGRMCNCGAYMCVQQMLKPTHNRICNGKQERKKIWNFGHDKTKFEFELKNPHFASAFLFTISQSNPDAKSVKCQSAPAAFSIDFIKTKRQIMSKGRVFIYRYVLFSIKIHTHTTAQDTISKREQEKKAKQSNHHQHLCMYSHTDNVKKEWKKKRQRTENRWPFMRSPLSIAVCNKSGHEIYVLKLHLPFNFYHIHMFACVSTFKNWAALLRRIYEKYPLNWRMKRRQWQQNHDDGDFKREWMGKKNKKYHHFTRKAKRHNITKF